MKITNLESVFAESLPGPEALRHRERKVPRWEITSDEIRRFKATTAAFETCSEGGALYYTETCQPTEDKLQRAKVLLVCRNYKQLYQHSVYRQTELCTTNGRLSQRH